MPLSRNAAMTAMVRLQSPPSTSGIRPWARISTTRLLVSWSTSSTAWRLWGRRWRGSGRHRVTGRSPKSTTRAPAAVSRSGSPARRSAAGPFSCPGPCAAALEGTPSRPNSLIIAASRDTKEWPILRPSSGPSPAGSRGESRDQGVDEKAGDPAVGVEGGVEDRDVEAGGVVAGDRRSEDGGQLLPGQAAGEVVVDGGHDGVVEDVDVEVDPEPGGAALALQVGEGVAGRPPGTSVADRRQVQGVDGRSQGPASLGGGMVGVAEAEHHHVFVAEERAPALEVGDQLRAAAGDQGEFHRGGLARGFGLGLVEVGMAVEEQQA